MKVKASERETNNGARLKRALLGESGKIVHKARVLKQVYCAYGNEDLKIECTWRL